MKIFNWVHRRFKDGSSAQNAKKNGVVADDQGTNAKQFLFENNAFDDVFGCWKGGILTIGTFGYDPLMKDDEIEEINGDKEDLVNHKEFECDQITDSEEEENEVEQEEEDEDDNYDNEDEQEKDIAVNPLVYAVYDGRDYEGLLEYDNYSVINPEGIKKMNGDQDLEFDEVMMMMKERDEGKKERITLADLFSADSEDLQLQVQKKEMISKNKLSELIKEKANSTTKHGLSFAKKLDSTRPIHKLHRLMRKMLKRKIHPELGVLNKEINGDNDQMIDYTTVVGEKCQTIESVPLLQITRDGNDG